MIKKLISLTTLIFTLNVFSNLEEVIVIDVRSQAEWNTGHLLRATRMDWNTIADQILEVAPNKDIPIVLYCRSGNRAGKSMKILDELGYTNLTNAGGLESARALLQDTVIKD
jgi:phage shock protein E